MDTIEERIKKTEFVVEATGAERQLLWEKFAKDAIHQTPLNTHEWVQLNPGWTVVADYFCGIPISLMLTWARVDGILVMFWEPTGPVSHHDTAQKYLADQFTCRCNFGTRRAHTNAMNFHHVLDYAREVAESRNPESTRADDPRPISRAELLEWLGNIRKMHTFALACEYGSKTHRLYFDGMPRCADFIAECVRHTPVGTI